ncbi:MAG: MiaB/RimO family radical SAM methylthiotransferase [Lentisphaerae bacterium]|nr:MiaB/RimO family radical SAM methylthiotransferase [Lentisphaerota bacterium]
MSASDPGPRPPDAGSRPSPPATYAVRVLGCKVNQYEAQQIARVLEARGLAPAADGAPPGVTVIHTCAVTAESLRQSNQTVRRARAGGGGIVVATGCAGANHLLDAGVEPDAIVASGPRWAEDLAAALDRLLPRDGGGDATPGGPPVERFGGHTRAFLKIQDGCDLGCSYCIVPSLRGAPRDKPLAALLDEARGMVRAGHVEIVVTGVSVGLWGRGCGGLASALEGLAGVEGLRRIRLSSLHPADLTADLLRVMAAVPRFMPHVHLPLQSGSDAVLARMNRGYDRAGFLAAVDRARAALDRPAFTSDVIAGFPGETEADFDATLGTCRAAGFSRIHVFPYSPRPGTPAADAPDRVSRAVARERARRLRAAGDELRDAFHRRFLGDTVPVLCETRTADGAWEGHDPRYIPVRFAGPPDLKGRIAAVRLERLSGDGVLGRQA